MSSSRPQIDLAEVCRAIVIGQDQLRSGEKNVSLWAIYRVLTKDRHGINYFASALREAKAFGLVIEGPRGYRLSAEGKRSRSQPTPGDPTLRFCSDESS